MIRNVQEREKRKQTRSSVQYPSCLGGRLLGFRFSYSVVLTRLVLRAADQRHKDRFRMGLHGNSCCYRNNLVGCSLEWGSRLNDRSGLQQSSAMKHWKDRG